MAVNAADRMPIMSEDEVVWPDKLRAQAVPRRGGAPAPVKRIKPADRALILDRRERHVRELLSMQQASPVHDEKRGDDALIAAGRAELDGAASPLGAAVVGMLTAGQLLWAEQGALPALAETWWET